MREQQFYVVVFDSTHSAIAAEGLLRKKNYEIDTIPTPREITASCGLSIKFNQDLLANIKKELKKAEISAKGIYKIKRIKNIREVERID